MKLTINGRKFHVTDDLTEKITAKLAKFDKFFGDEAVCDVLVRSAKNREIMEITIRSRGTVFRSEVEDEAALNALDKCVDVLERQIRKNKTRLERRLKIGAFDKTVLADKQWDDVKEEEIKITRTKNFTLMPMTPEEAVLQMNLLGHTFFLFLDEKTDAPSVVYKKKNDEYGLITTGE